MDNPVNSREVLIADLRGCSAAIGVGDPRSAPLRSLQKKLRLLIETSNDFPLKPLCFILDGLISDYYLNFAGDVLSLAAKKVDDIRKELLQDHIRLSLDGLADSLASDQSLYEHIDHIITSYLLAARQANEEIGGW